MRKLLRSEPIYHTSIHLVVVSGSNTPALSRRNTVLIPRKDGILGGTKTNSLWVDDAAGRVKLGCHLRFDEGMNDLALDELPPNVKIFLHSGTAPPIDENSMDGDPDAMMFYSSNCPFKSKRTFTVKISCKHPTFGIAVDMDELFHKPYICDVSKSKKTSIYSISSSPKNVGRNLKGAYIVAINDVAIFSEANAVDAFAAICKSKDKTFKLIVGCLDNISTPEAQRELDKLLLHTSHFSAESSKDLQDDDEDVVLQPQPMCPIAPPPTHEHNISVPTPGTCRSPGLMAKENLTIQSIVIKPHLLSDVDPFD